jgi:hypothetical protein
MGGQSVSSFSLFGGGDMTISADDTPACHDGY